MLSSVVLASLLSTLVPSAQASVLKATWSASSAAPTENGISYEAKNLADGKISTAWFEGVDGSGLNEWVLADLGGEHSVNGFTIWGGYGYSRTYWGHYNRPKSVVVEFSDGSTQEFPLADTFGAQEVNFPSPKKTASLRFRVKAAYSSDAYNDTAISEIQIRDGAKDNSVPVAGVSSSSVFPADADGNYEGRNTVDGLLDTMWCEGNKTGDGTGDWVEYTFAGPQSVSSLVLRNGNGTSFGLFMKGNRVTQATLAFGDGSRETVMVKDTISEQVLTFSPRSTTKVRLTVDVVKKGSEFNDLCLSEVAFRP